MRHHLYPHWRSDPKRSGSDDMQRRAEPASTPPALAAIPVIETGPDFPMATLLAEEARAHRLLDAATQVVPRRALGALDAISRR